MWLWSFVLIQHQWNGPFLGFLGPCSPKYYLILLKFWPEVVFNKTSRVFEKSFKINGKHPKFTVLFRFGTQCTAGKPKILLKTKMFEKTTSLGISNSVSTRSQKKYRILVKLNRKKHFGGSKLSLNCPLLLRQKVNGNSHILYNRNILLHILDANFQFLCICCSRLYLEEALHVFVLELNCAHFRGFWSNNSSK